MFPSSFWVLLVLVRSASSLPIPAVPVSFLPFIICLSVIPSSLAILFIAKVVYIKNRRIESIHRPTLRLPFFVGLLGSPDWEIKMKQSIENACMVERHGFHSESEYSWPVDEFGAHYSCRRVSIYSRSLLPSLPPLAHISASPRNPLRQYLPVMATSDSSPLSLQASSEGSGRVRLVSINSQDSPSFLPVMSRRFSNLPTLLNPILAKPSPILQTGAVLQHNIITSPQKIERTLHQKSAAIPFLPIQTPPISPLSRVEPSEIRSTVLHFDNSKQASPLVVQRMAHPYAAKATYDFPRSPHPSYENSPNYGESSSSNPLSLVSSPATSSRSPHHALINNSLFFSVSAKPYSDKNTIEPVAQSASSATAKANCIVVSDPMNGTQDLENTKNVTVNNQRGLGILTSAKSIEQNIAATDSTAKRKRKRPSPLFSIPEEDMQSLSSKSFKRISSGNSSATWRNSWNTASGEVGIAFTAVSVPSARIEVVDDDHLFVEADDGEEGSRACLIGLLEELEEWGCEWVENKDATGPPMEVGRAW